MIEPLAKTRTIIAVNNLALNEEGLEPWQQLFNQFK